MPTLFPPLEAEGDGDSFLPADVRANFEGIQAILRAQSRLGKEQDLSPIASSDQLQGTDNKPNDVGRRIAGSEDPTLAEEGKAEGLESRKRTLAMTTAVAVQSEISRLTNGIAELESLLLQQGNGVNPSEIEFPALPTAIIEEDAEDGQEKESGSSEVEDADSSKEEMDVLDRTKK